MPKMIVSIDGVVIKDVQLTKERTTLGRRPYNDIVIDNLAISGEHAVIQLTGREVYLEDLNSTNGTFVNGKAVKKQLLLNGDAIEIGKYKIKFQQEAEGEGFEKTMIIKPGSMPAMSDAFNRKPLPMGRMIDSASTSKVAASIKVLSGAAAGREVALIKVVTTIGKPGVAVAAITRRPQGFVLIHVEGSVMPSLNGSPTSGEPVTLKSGDMLELAGTEMQFVQA